MIDASSIDISYEDLYSLTYLCVCLGGLVFTFIAKGRLLIYMFILAGIIVALQVIQIILVNIDLLPASNKVLSNVVVAQILFESVFAATY